LSKLFPALFVTYDGLLDPLGGSQILPYLRSIASHPRSLHIVSFEKPDRFAAGAEILRSQLATSGIEWTPLSFTTRLGKLGKLWDLGRMYGACFRLHLRRNFGVIHCRSYQAMQVGALLNRLTGVRTIFDMRGLWVNERVDGGLWTQDRWLNRMAYRIYKRIERRLLASASHVVALTERVVPELQRLSPGMTAPVTVIPCCADFDHFVLPTDVARLAMRAEHGIAPGAMVLSYLGSLGTWYMLDEMLRLFAAAAHQRDDVELLLITRDWGEEHEALLKTMGLQALRDRIHVRSASRDQVPTLLGSADIMLSFIKPAYSKIASSPTKLAEAFAVGIPVISNAGVGDVDQITSDLDAGAVIDLSGDPAFDQIVIQLDRIRLKGGLGLRTRSRERLGLEVATRAYRRIYSSLENCP
jgi:glycosyltransferase involved in cell wall biosynthesis